MKLLLALTLFTTGCINSPEQNDAMDALRRERLAVYEKADKVQNALIEMCVEKGGVPIVALLGTRLEDCKFPHMLPLPGGFEVR